MMEVEVQVVHHQQEVELQPALESPAQQGIAQRPSELARTGPAELR